MSGFWTALAAFFGGGAVMLVVMSCLFVSREAKDAGDGGADREEEV